MQIIKVNFPLKEMIRIRLKMIAKENPKISIIELKYVFHSK